MGHMDSNLATMAATNGLSLDGPMGHLGRHTPRPERVAEGPGTRSAVAAAPNEDLPPSECRLVL